MKQSRFPKGWDEDRVKRVLAHYESQSEEEAMAEDLAAREDSSHMGQILIINYRQENS
jgi:hypothetical protein